MRVKQTCMDCQSKLLVGKNWSAHACKMGQYLCRRCNNDRSVRLKKSRKRDAIEYLGGKCSKCNGVFHEACYDFHHRDPKQKDVNPAQLFGNKWETLKKEIDKCVLLCSNCHRVTHVMQKEPTKSNPRKPKHQNHLLTVRDSNTGRVFKDHPEAAEYYGVDRTTISNWVRGVFKSRQGVQLEYV